MSRNQRLTFLGIAAVIAVVAVVLLTAGDGSDESAQDSATTSAQLTATPSGTPTPAETQEATPTPTPKPQPPLLQAGKVTKLRFKEGETVRFRVRHDGPEHVHVHGYDKLVDLQPGKTETVSFKATITGIFEIELEDSAEQIGELRVDPR